MSDETTRAAAERVMQIGPCFCGVNTLCDECCAREVATEWLSEHPADDAELIDEEWVRSTPGECIRDDEDDPQIGHVVVFVIDSKKNLRIGWDSAGAGNTAYAYVGYGTEFINVKTRGEARRLCAALGLPLTPPSPTSTH